MMKPFIKIGRDNNNDIVINEPRVSRFHALITNVGDGTFEIKDLSSANGTFVNGNRIELLIITPEDKVEVATCLVNWHQAFNDELSDLSNQMIKEEPHSRIIKTISVGSADDCDIRLENRFVSSHHATISRLKSGGFYLEDLASSNGVFVNNSRVSRKNFTKTDIVRIAAADLPTNWFRHKKLKPNLFKDHIRGWIILFILLLISVAGSLSYINRCEWFNYGCNLTAEQIYLQNTNSLVHLVHSYYYKIDYRGKSYYVGKNSIFKVTEANTSKDHLLPYGTVAGSGCFVKEDGTILTSATLVNPWMYGDEREKMIKEVIASRTLDKFTADKAYEVCGETADLKWLANGMINNPQNYITATSDKSCREESGNILVRSVKSELPENANLILYNYDTIHEERLINTPAYYYSYIKVLQPDVMLEFDFHMSTDSLNINMMDIIPLAGPMPGLTEGSIVLNERGELVGNIQNNNLTLIHRYYKQLKNH